MKFFHLIISSQNHLRSIALKIFLSQAYKLFLLSFVHFHTNEFLFRFLHHLSKFLSIASVHFHTNHYLNHLLPILIVYFFFLLSIFIPMSFYSVFYHIESNFKNGIKGILNPILYLYSDFIFPFLNHSLSTLVLIKLFN